MIGPTYSDIVIDRMNKDHWTKPFQVYKRDDLNRDPWIVAWGSWIGAWARFDTFEAAIRYASRLDVNEHGITFLRN